ncbi:glycine-rich domain-containing protein [Actinomadura sp. 1N219]|uniref:glycine-rich domain-containing protein n=1 Tax=Actinomadura sp. 1N219 TaxID=3375152 RepID=UPI0037B2098B
MTTGTVQDVGRTGTKPRDPKSFVDPQVWERQIALLVRDHPFDTVMAERLFGQAVAYLITAMEKWGENLEIGCGPLVDIAVHGFILDTRNYREFCDRHFGRFMEHIPAVEFKHDGSVERTAHVIEVNGFAIDWPLWEADFAKCTPCYPGSNCH